MVEGVVSTGCGCSVDAAERLFMGEEDVCIIFGFSFLVVVVMVAIALELQVVEV